MSERQFEWLAESKAQDVLISRQTFADFELQYRNFWMKMWSERTSVWRDSAWQEKEILGFIAKYAVCGSKGPKIEQHKTYDSFCTIKFVASSLACLSILKARVLFLNEIMIRPSVPW